MEVRISRLESLTQLSVSMTRTINEHMYAMDERQRQTEEWQRQREERHIQRDQLLQQMFQTVAVMQADIVRIDETHY